MIKAKQGSHFFIPQRIANIERQKKERKRKKQEAIDENIQNQHETKQNQKKKKQRKKQEAIYENKQT